MKILIAYRNNDLFQAYLPEIWLNEKFANDTVEKIVFPKGSDEGSMTQKISEVAANYGADDKCIYDKTIRNILESIGRCDLVTSTRSPLDLHINFNSSYDLHEICVHQSADNFFKTIKELLAILNTDNKSIAIVKSHIVDHVTSSFVNIPQQVYENRGAEQWFAEYIKDGLQLDNIQIVWTVAEASREDFIIVDRHADIEESALMDMHKGNRLLLPVESAIYEAEELGRSIYHIKREELIAALTERLIEGL